MANRRYFAKEYNLNSTEQREWAINEINILSKLKHPNIVKLHGFMFDHSSQSHFVTVLEDIGTETLRQALKRLDLEEVLAAFAQLLDVALVLRVAWFHKKKKISLLIVAAQAVSYMHAQGVVHANLDLTNVMFTERGPVIISFTNARRRQLFSQNLGEFYVFSSLLSLPSPPSLLSRGWKT